MLVRTRFDDEAPERGLLLGVARWLLPASLSLCMSISSVAAQTPPVAPAPAAPSTAPSAQAPDHEHPPFSASTRAASREYPGPVMVADGLALGFGLTGFALLAACTATTLDFGDDGNSAESVTCPLAAVLLAAGAGTFVLAAPIIHFAHERPPAALLSFTLRAGLPAGAIALGVATEKSSLAAAAFVSAIAAAVVVDWVVLTRPGERDELQWSLVPLERGASLSLHRRF